VKKIIAAGMIFLFLGNVGLVWAEQHSPPKKAKGKRSHKSKGSSSKKVKPGEVRGSDTGSEVPVDPKSGRPKGSGPLQLDKTVQ